MMAGGNCKSCLHVLNAYIILDYINCRISVQVFVFLCNLKAEEVFKGQKFKGVFLNFSCLFFVFFFLGQILTIPVKAVIAVGSLTCSPKHVFLPPSFPVRELGKIKCLLAMFLLYMPFSRETTVLNSVLLKRLCHSTVMISLSLFWGLFEIFLPCVPNMSCPYISSAAHLNGILGELM